MNSLSVVIPSHNALGTLGPCLETLMGELDWRCDEIIVVDSSGGTGIDALCRRFPEVHWRRQPEKLFPGAARNLGFRLVRKEWVAFLDADIIVRKGWRRAISRLSPDQVAAGGPIAPAHPQTRWGLARYWIEFGQFSERNLPRRTWNIPSCNMVWRSSAFAETSGFPENFRSADDLLFNFRNMKLRGRRFTLLPELGVLHPADYDREATEAHLRELGYWSGKARREGVRPQPGRSFLALPLLYAYRCCRVWRRCLRAGGPAQLGPLLAPIAKATVWWCQGFYRGLQPAAKEGNRGT
ncbi:MAG: glycosyltransferase family 2 protein [Acidobacteria bacterium]|nr:glycosyltransferase family 2 protein [Acidobacteriota bacterium]